MLKIAMIACAAVVSAVAAAQGVLMLGKPAQAKPSLPVAAVAMAAPVTQPEPAPVSSSAAVITKSADGHFWAEAAVNGARVRFLVDTGATAVALSPRDAQRLGFSPGGLNYEYKVTTANGEARAARIKLRTVAVAGARVNDVEAYVIEKGLDDSLLGMSYLGRLNRFEASRNTLILRP